MICFLSINTLREGKELFRVKELLRRIEVWDGVYKVNAGTQGVNRNRVLNYWSWLYMMPCRISSFKLLTHLHFPVFPSGHLVALNCGLSFLIVGKAFTLGNLTISHLTPVL